MKYLCTLGIVVLCLATACSEEDRTFADKHADKAEKTAAAYRKKVQAEIETLRTHEWAGEYYEGDGLGENVSLVLAPKGDGA
jgi:hypothetical protein